MTLRPAAPIAAQPSNITLCAIFSPEVFSTLIDHGDSRETPLMSNNDRLATYLHQSRPIDEKIIEPRPCDLNSSAGLTHGFEPASTSSHKEWSCERRKLQACTSKRERATVLQFGAALGDLPADLTPYLDITRADSEDGQINSSSGPRCSSNPVLGAFINRLWSCE